MDTNPAEATRIEKILSRYTGDWSDIIGLPAWNAVRYREEYLHNPDKVPKYVLGITHAGQDLLLKKETRSQIYRLLKDSEIQELSKLLDIKKSEYPRKKLNENKISGDKRDKLFNFFNVPLIKTVSEEKIPDYEQVPVKYPLHDYQKNILVRAIAAYNEETKNNFMIHMPTGSGKTRVAMSLISRILMQSEKTVILWLAYSEELCDQASSEFISAWSAIGDRDLTVERMYGNHNYTSIDDGLLVASLGKLWAASKKENTFISFLSKKISAVVFDEAHQSLAPTYYKMLDELKLYNSEIRFIGLSATPGRTDENETYRMSSLFDHKKITLKIEGYSSPIKYLYDEKYLSVPTFHKIIYKSETVFDYSAEENGIDYSEKLRKILGNDYNRNFQIFDEVCRCVQSGHKRIIMFAASVNSAEYISALLNNEGIDSLIVTSKTDPDTRRTTLEKFKSDTEEAMVLCNYGILTTGFDAPKTTAAIIGRPTKSQILYSQMVGRALRGTKMGGTDTADIFVMVDINLPGSSSVIEAFEEWGKNDGWNEN